MKLMILMTIGVVGCVTRLKVESRRGTLFVIVSTPILNLFLRIGKAQEPVCIQTLGSEATVERFDKRIVGRLSWSTEVERHTVGIGP